MTTTSLLILILTIIAIVPCTNQCQPYNNVPDLYTGIYFFIQGQLPSLCRRRQTIPSPLLFKLIILPLPNHTIGTLRFATVLQSKNCQLLPQIYSSSIYSFSRHTIPNSALTSSINPIKSIKQYTTIVSPIEKNSCLEWKLFFRTN